MFFEIALQSDTICFCLPQFRLLEGGHRGEAGSREHGGRERGLERHQVHQLYVLQKRPGQLRKQGHVIQVYIAFYI